MPHLSGVDVNWPGLEELKETLDVTSGDWDVQLHRQMEAAIAQVKLDVGDWDEAADLPDEGLAHAALRLAVLGRANAEAPTASLTADPVYQRYLKGHRRRFPIA